MIQGIQNQSNNGIIEKYCYNNDSNYCDIYGGLYQWHEAMAYETASSTKGICPEGWHIPSQEEFEILATTVNNNANALKTVGQSLGSTNESNFSGLLGGTRDMLGNSYFGLGKEVLLLEFFIDGFL